ncbi:MAG TPA: threonine ammonia-lyase, partial [Pilimelia sp.]|nr:threonine ammonia-lyase [Pilimelia sp.]
LCGCDVYAKLDYLQATGSFKERGARNKLLGLDEATRGRGVVAASAGNHAQGVALAAGLLGATATVFMPVGAPLPKIAATRGYGAHVELMGDTVDESLAAAVAFAGRSGAVFIHPFDHPDVIAGQGTVALEILAARPEVETIVTSVGGGGLVSGVAVAAKALKPQIRVVGVQAEGAAAFPPSLRAGAPVRLPGVHTIADGIAVGQPGQLTYAHVSKLVDDVVTVTDEDISRALLMLLERAKLVAEPAGATAAAALLVGKAAVRPPAVAVLSGGNIDPLLMVKLIEHGLTAAGRYLRITIRCADRPGQLASLLSLVGGTRANVTDIEHRRHDPRLSFGEVEVVLSVETRGGTHSGELVGLLRSAGYDVTVH